MVYQGYPFAEKNIYGNDMVQSVNCYLSLYADYSTLVVSGNCPT